MTDCYEADTLPRHREIKPEQVRASFRHGITGGAPAQAGGECAAGDGGVEE